IAFAISSASLEETGRTADDTDWNPECYGSSTCRPTPPFTSNRITGPTFRVHLAKEALIAIWTCSNKV
ncbi:hypothetical protein, partial [Salinibacter ruber]|uniref:hypothetical protein n=1 Tax=Salinibacter ruber TaxID=146919 RepID=UPI001CA54EC8